MALSGVMIVLTSSAERTKVDFIAKWLAGGIWGTDWPFIVALRLADHPDSVHPVQSAAHESAGIKRSRGHRRRRIH